ARADAEHLRAEQLRLPLFADLGQQEMPAVADLLLARELLVLLDRQALVLPAAEAALHGDDVRVAELLENPAREQRARAAGAIGDDRRRLVGHLLLDLHLEEAARDGDGAGDVTLPHL